MSDSENKNGRLKLAARVGTFVRGLNLLQPLQLCLLGSSFALRRFGFDKDAVSVFVGLCHNSMELVYLCSAMASFLLLSLSKLNDSLYRWFSLIFSSLSVCFTVAVNVLLLAAYKYGEVGDGMTYYYWLLVLANFAAGIDDMCISTVAADALSQYDCGQAMTGIVVAVFHWVAMKVIDRYDKDVNYWLIFSQIAFITILSAIAAVVWIWFLIEKTMAKPSNSGSGGKNGDKNFGKALAKVLPMMIVSTLGYGVIYIIYPLISPFEMVEFEYHYPIQRLCLLFHALSGFIVWIIDLTGGLDKSWYEGNLGWLHLLWFLVIPFFGTGYLFVHCLHYPNSRFAQAIVDKPKVVTFLTALYYFTGRFTTGISYVAIAANGGETHGEILSAINLAINLLTLNGTKYISEAYIQEVRVAKKNSKNGAAWPTEGMTKYDAVVYWFKVGLIKGYSNFKELATTNVQERLSGSRITVTHNRNVTKELPGMYQLGGEWNPAATEDVNYFGG